MTTPTTPHTINPDVFRRARRAGLPLNTAAYVARPAVIELDWLSHFQFDGEWTTFGHGGRRFQVTVTDPAVTEGECVACRELVDAYERRDDGIAWMTPDEYDATDHRVMTVTLLDDDDDETAHTASLLGVCGPRNTEMERLADDRYLAETALDLASEAAREAGRADERDADRAAAIVAARRARVVELTERARQAVIGGRILPATVLAEVWADPSVDIIPKRAATFFAILGRDGVRLDDLTNEVFARATEEAERITPTD